MKSSERSLRRDWLIPAGLVLLSLVPVAAGASRLMRLATGGPNSIEDARFFASPAPVTLHIVAVSLYAVIGAFQFSPRLRRRGTQWHRRAGWVLLPCGFLSALTGLWMTLFYPRIETDSAALFAIRLTVASAMIATFILAVLALPRRAYRAHGAWMIRAYALGQGAGTQVLTHLPWIILLGTPGPTSRAILMAAGWVINILVAEWAIRRSSPQVVSPHLPMRKV